jgi:hypothetical protein
VAVVALALWTLTVAAGVYLLVTSTRVKSRAELDDVPGRDAALEPEEALVAGAGAGPAPAQVPAARKKRDMFDPPSLRENKSESIPGMRALGEFTHPALAITGFAFWLLYTMVHDRIFAAIALGVILGAIAAGISFAVSNDRAAKKGKRDALSFSGRTLAFHVAGATLTVLLAALITARVV